MKFGSAETEELSDINWLLPDDHSQNARILGGTPAGDPKVYTGCGKWGIKEWIGHIYPKGTRSADFLREYSKVFNSVELNNTFYRLNRPSIDDWTETVTGSDFKFCPKFSRRISHLRRIGPGSEENTSYFIDAVLQFGDHLGAPFLQMPENFGPKHLERFHTWLTWIPDEFPLFVELRHREWFEDPVFGEITDLLEKHGKGLAITDTALRRDVVHQRLTTPQAFIRFNGYGLHPSDFQRLDDWARRITDWLRQGLQTVYFFGHQQNELHTPRICVYFLRKLKELSGLDIVVPEIGD
jgi:uncharacterized protein YecE (DUF72 family)